MSRTPQTVIHIFHDDADSLGTGSRVAQRIHEVADESGIGVEVFCFGPAQRALAGSGVGGEAVAVFNQRIDELIVAGVRVTACINSARADGNDADLTARGLTLRVARDEFVRHTLEGATVISF